MIAGRRAREMCNRRADHGIANEGTTKQGAANRFDALASVHLHRMLSPVRGRYDVEWQQYHER